jgi:tRNA threonylcarbamoyladenosine biosynthesis protein TsaE
MYTLHFQTYSEEETIDLGVRLGRELPQDSVVCFFGDLGTGKTACIKGIVSGLQANEEIFVSSPTYTYLHIYEGVKPIYHFDLYRLNTATEFISMGFDDYFYAGGICCIEWAERIQSVLPVPHVSVVLTYGNAFYRDVVINSNDKISI